MVDDSNIHSRRNALKCVAFGGCRHPLCIVGSIFTPIDLAAAAANKNRVAAAGKPLFVQISDSHIGFNKEADPNVNSTLTQSIDLIDALPVQPALIIHTGDTTHLSKPAEFDTAQH